MNTFEPMTQGQLNSLFEKLGFHLTVIENGPHVWENPQFDALMILPALSSDCPARPHHLMTLRKTVDEREIVDMETFEKLVEEVRHQNAGSLAKAS